MHTDKTNATLASYLENFAYIHDESVQRLTRCSPGLRLKMLGSPSDTDIRLFQRAHGLPETGSVDEATALLLARPRCGNRDFLSIKRAETKWLANGRRWDRTNLTYRLVNLTGDLDQGQVLVAIRNAFATWANASPLRFQETSGAADIDISWHSGAHGDNRDFDGPSGTLAHGFYPPPNGTLAGDIHFDEAETWGNAVPEANGQTDLESVALHEIGHALGLEHSSDASAVMYAYHSGVRRQLTPDDVNGITAIYSPLNRMFVSEGSGEALDGGDPNYPHVYMYPTPNSANAWHLWQLRPVLNHYMILSVGYGGTRALDAGAADGWVYLHSTPLPMNDWQLWSFQAAGGGRWLVINKANGRALDAGAIEPWVYTHPNPDPNNAWHLWRISPAP